MVAELSEAAPGYVYIVSTPVDYRWYKNTWSCFIFVGSMLVMQLLGDPAFLVYIDTPPCKTHTVYTAVQTVY